MANEYASFDELQAWGTVFDTVDNPSMAIALEAASRQIDDHCGQRFWLDDTPTARYYTADRDGELRVDAIGSSEGLVLSVDQNRDGSFEDSWAIDADFLLAPRNAAAEGRPWTKLKPTGWSAKRFPRCADSAKVTARWGWPVVPAAVKQATLIQASRLLKRKDTPLGVEGEIAARVPLPPRLDLEAETLLLPFTKIPVG